MDGATVGPADGAMVGSSLEGAFETSIEGKFEGVWLGTGVALVGASE